MSCTHSWALNQQSFDHQFATGLYLQAVPKCALHSLGAGLTDVNDVGEEVVVLGLGHGLAELRRVLEHAYKDLQAV